MFGFSSFMIQMKALEFVYHALTRFCWFIMFNGDKDKTIFERFFLIQKLCIPNLLFFGVKETNI